MAININLSSEVASEISPAGKALNAPVNNLLAGSQISIAEEDATEIGFYQLLRSDVASARQSSRNVSDGLSILQSLKASFEEVLNNLKVMKGFVLRAETGGVSEQHMQTIQEEFNNLDAANQQVAK